MFGEPLQFWAKSCGCPISARAPSHNSKPSKRSLRSENRARSRARRMGLHLRSRRLQSGAVAEAHGGLPVKAPANCRLIGRWRIVEADLWDRAHLDLCGSGSADDHRARRRNRLRRLGGRPRSRIRPRLDRFHRAGCEEGDEVEGEGTAELLDDGTIEIEFAYRNGDEAVLKAKRDPSSTAC